MTRTSDSRRVSPCVHDYRAFRTVQAAHTREQPLQSPVAINWFVMSTGRKNGLM